MAKRVYKPKTNQPKISNANRGMQLQNLINYTNNIYDLADLAVVREVPTPTTQNKEGKRIFTGKSTVDYYGIANGHSLVFDAKSTRDKSKYPLDKIHAHQVEYMKKVQQQKGIAFLIIEFALLGKTYFVSLDFLLKHWQTDGKKGLGSIPFEDIDQHCPQIMPTRGVALDYLAHCQTGGKNDEHSIKKGGLTISVQ